MTAYPLAEAAHYLNVSPSTVRWWAVGRDQYNGLIVPAQTQPILALSFLILVGVTLMVEGFDVHVPKGYIYFAMAFSVGVEMLNIRFRKNRPVDLHGVSLSEAGE